VGAAVEAPASDPVDPEAAPDPVDPPLATVEPPVAAGLVVAPLAAGSLVFAAVVVEPVAAGLVADPPEPVTVPEVVEEELPDPLVATGLGLATGVGLVTRLVAPRLDDDVLVGAVANVVPTVLAVTGRRTLEVLDAGGGGVVAAPPDTTGADEPFASRPAARSPASGVAGALGTIGGGTTTGALATGC
jgi:hypothetical protein